MKTGGRLIVEGLEAQGVDRVFCVPGESYLAVLDALVDSGIRPVLARQEGGAAMMAEADGKLTGRPGICFVTRGPGATNAASGVHVAQQDATPMILFVGQIGRRMRGRDAFQEVDYRQFFGGMAKWVEEIDHADRIPEVLSHAFHVAMSGRPGPVVIALPEDMLSGEAPALAPAPRVEVAAPAPAPADIATLAELLARAERPVLVAGGSRWAPEDAAALAAFAEACDLPVACSFRRQMLLDNTHPNYAGDIGLGPSPALAKRIREADLLILLGARFSENPSQGFSLLGIPAPEQALVHIHPGPEELGRIYAPRLAINATPGQFLAAAAGLSRPASGAAAEANAEWHAWSDTPPETPGAVQMGAVIAHLNAGMPDACITNGAGNYATWAHRFFRYRGWGSQLAPTSGSMGYGLPAAIAGKLRMPGREVVAFAGDGCLQMTMQEFGTACQEGAALLLIVVDNGIYGTIRMHQEREYPARVSATTLQNPDFAAIARAYGAFGARVERTEDFAPALAEARASGGPALLHLLTSPEAITPARTLTQIREKR
ncbi:thiamine pyrophosphate-binding protein [Oceanicella sp. SM1341]|uniref:thiamine pyrophosphate-binding protein n=1 Tax=Oceanicella sp. SM1341 TaxID=1548889 RepID=UPI000E46F324|nr:thiamine pyrophosphate-binding protein [Oceanicella sp. SM1341]